MKKLPLDITDKALSEIHKTLKTKNIPDEYGLRIGVRGAGCAGVSYILGFDKKKGRDEEFNLNGLKIYIQKGHIMYLINLKLDFYEGVDAKGYTFIKSEEYASSNAE